MSDLEEMQARMEHRAEAGRCEKGQYKRIIKEMKEKSYWQLRLLSTPVKVSGWDGSFPHALFFRRHMVAREISSSEVVIPPFSM